jgi:hypothetical protein
MEAVRTSETSVDNHFTRQYIPEENSEHHTRCRKNLKSHVQIFVYKTLDKCNKSKLAFKDWTQSLLSLLHIENSKYK